MEPMKCDIALVGGGLAGGLALLALTERRPELKVLLIERDRFIGGNHIWSFFGSDVSAEHRWLIAPLVSTGWPGYRVRFPGHERELDTRYYSVESERLDDRILSQVPADRLLLGQEVKAVSPRLVVLKGGQRIQARGVVDARGPGDSNHLECGWQKFVGRMIDCDEPHGVDRPILMDATVEQADGYRFVYVLPFGPTRLFVEDTYYSDRPELDRRKVARRIQNYVAQQGWKEARVLREEAGVLPVLMGGNLERYWVSGSSRVAKLGGRGSFFHPTTSYSLPDAVRNAVLLCEQEDIDGDALHALFHTRAKALWKERSFYRMLDRMLFRAAKPDERYKIFERFYTLAQPIIERFYAGESTAGDRMRILAGKPPVSVGRALKAIGGLAVR